MAVITCHSCKKPQPFMERMMYCSFCGAHYMESNIFNALKRSKQDVIIRRWSWGYIFGGMLIVMFVLPAILLHFVPDEASRKNISSIAAIVWERRIRRSFVLSIA